MMRQFGIIGFPLTQSFSPTYFTKKFQREGIKNCNYKAYPLSNVDEFRKLTENISFSGLNVTIPYKESVLPFLDALSDTATEIGAVNTILFEEGKLIGHNTDVYGFEQSLLPLLASLEELHPTALVLGTGGASKAVVYVFNKLNIPFSIVSRDKNKGMTYDEITKDIMEKHTIIVNTTPLGMMPDIDTFPDLPYSYLKKSHFLMDLIYSPKKTVFLTKGSEHKCIIKNGWDMLIYQAEKSWELWNRK